MLADELGCTMAQLAIAWCAHNPHMSSVITGASNADQLRSNLAALDVLPLLSPDVLGRLDAISPPMRGPRIASSPTSAQGASIPSKSRPLRALVR